MNTEVLEPEIVLPAIIPVVELEKINATNAGLMQMRQKAIELVEVGTPDRPAYEAIHDLAMVAINVRTESERIGKRLIEPKQNEIDAIRKEYRRIGEHAKETQMLLMPLKLAYEEQQDRIKEEKAKAEAAKLATRIDNLYALGATCNGLTYNVHGVLIDSVEVKALPDSEYEELYQSALTAHQNEQKRLADIETARIAEQNRIATEQQAERDRQAIIAKEQETERLRLQAQADENDRKAKALQDQQDELDRKQREAENARLQAIADEQARLDAIENERRAQLSIVRINRLIGIGFVDNGPVLNHYDCQIYKSAISAFDDAAFEMLIVESMTLNDQKAAQAKQDIIDAKKAESDRKKADKERTARLKLDKKRLKDFVKTIYRLPMPAYLDNAEATDLLAAFDKEVSALVDSFNDRVDAL